IWRDWQNAEMKLEATLHEDVELSFATAHDDSRRQIQQIDSLVESGIDLLIVAPNQLQNVSPAIDRAYDRGLPVIVFERKTDSQKYTAFVSADNYEMGRQIGNYIARQLGGRGHILEVLGLKGSSPADERHRGFRDAVAAYPEMNVVAALQGDWTEDEAYRETKAYLAKHPKANIDVVFGHNDRTAIGARRAFLEQPPAAADSLSGPHLPLFCGIDGLPGENGGIRQVRDSLLVASYIYPTRGDLLLQLALDILDGRPYEKEVLLTSALVTWENANVLLLESDEVLRRAQRLERLQAMADTYLQRLANQRIAMFLAFGVIGLLLAVLVLFYLYHRGKENIRRERVLNNVWNLDGNSTSVEEYVCATDAGKSPNPDDDQAPDAPVVPPSTPEEEAAEDDNVGTTGRWTAAETAFISRFRNVVESNMSDSELSVEDLATDMNLSRVQLYRKVKALTGSSPVEVLRSARLNRGHQLLMTTDKTVSEVAYAVGFSAPAYFTKCFKEEFGFVPGDVRK
ncbi:MAG: substrate-binding domain-containing protein, partial [Bacteroidaceae bacterium]|nr:substrate-binding domain-containing protein [Bacteroidaceae bacterium]